jgi:hypothetical protein
MKQKRLCLGVLVLLGCFTSLRAAWTTISLVLGLDNVPQATSYYNLFVAAGVWLVYRLVKQVPVAP